MPGPENPDGKRKWVETESLKPSPIRRDCLTEDQTARLRRIHETFAEVDGFTFEQRLDGFKRDMNPDRELEVWERSAAVHERFCASRQLSLEAKREVYRLLLMRSMTSEDETLRRTELKNLSRADAIAALRDLRVS